MRHTPFCILLAAGAALLSCACTPHLDTQADTLAWALGQNAAQSLLDNPIPNLDINRFQQAVGSTLDGKTAPKLDNMSDSLAWMLGEATAKNLQAGPLSSELDTKLFKRALAHTLKGRPSPLTTDQYNHAIASLVASVQAQAAREQEQADSAQKQYFAQLTADDPDIKHHPSGFYYKQLSPGQGPTVQYAQRILFNFHSYFMLTGQPSGHSSDPIIHVVGNPMFPGLIEAFQLMNAGSTYRFYFPFQLAYGAQGTSSIPPFTPLIYEIELLQTFDN